MFFTLTIEQQLTLQAIADGESGGSGHRQKGAQ